MRTANQAAVVRTRAIQLEGPLGEFSEVASSWKTLEEDATACRRRVRPPTTTEPVGLDPQMVSILKTTLHHETPGYVTGFSMVTIFKIEDWTH